MGTISVEQSRGPSKLHALQLQRVSGAALHRFASSIEIVLGECFCSPGYEREVFASMACRAEPVIWIAMDIEGTVIAFLGAFIIDAGEAASTLRIPSSQLPASLADADRRRAAGVIETVCVRPRWQRQGIGGRLVSLAEQDLEDQGASVIAIPGWKVGDRVNIGRTATRCGYSHEITVAGLWSPECDAGDYACCERQDRCVCEAAFYIKSFDR